MNSYTLYDLGMNIDGKKFILPFEVDEKDEMIFEKIINMISNSNIYERELFTDRVKDDKIKINKWNQIEINCLYEGYESYYPFTILIKVFRYKKESKNIYYDQKNKNEVKDNQLMISLIIEQEEGGLLEELIELKSLPSILEKLNLKTYYY